MSAFRMLGVHEVAAPAATAGRIPGAVWGGEFVAKPGGGPLPESTTEKQLVAVVLAKAKPYLDAGGGCIVRIKADMASVGKGNWDTRFAAVGAAVAGLNIVLILWHEPEARLKPGVFVPGFNRGRDAIKSGAGGVEVDYAGMAFPWRPGSAATRDPAAWTKDLRADRYLLDVYFGKSFESSLTLGTHPGLQRWLAEMILPYEGREWGLAEWGRRAGPDRAAGFTADFDWLATDPVGQTCSMVAVWGTDGAEGDPGWLLDQEAEDAIRAGFARLAIPAGYRTTDNPTVLVHEATGALIAADHTGAWDLFVIRNR